MKKIIAASIGLIFALSLLAVANAQTNFTTGVNNFIYALESINSQVQVSSLLSQNTKDSFDSKVNNDVAYFRSKLDEWSQASAEGKTAIQKEVNARIITVVKEVRLLLLQIGAESIDGVIDISQDMINKAPEVVNYFKAFGCSRTDELATMIPLAQQRLDFAKRNHEAAKQKLSQATPNMSFSEADVIIKEVKSITQNTVTDLKEVQRIGNEFNVLMQQIALELEDKLAGKDTGC